MDKEVKSVDKLNARINKAFGEGNNPATATHIPKKMEIEFPFHKKPKMDKLKEQPENKPKYTKKELKRKIRESKIKNFKKRVKKCAKTIMVLGGMVVGFYGSYNAAAYVQGKVDKTLDFETRDYYQNPNIEPGYYNKNPIKVCISDKFSSFNQHQIIKGIQELDKDAIGLSFDIRLGSGCELSPHEIFVEPENLEMNVLGRATLNPLTTYGIRGHIALDDKTLHVYGIKSTTIHELAHVIGLAHSKDITSLMYPISCRFGLSKEDIKNINTIYPAAQDDDFER